MLIQTTYRLTFLIMVKLNSETRPVAILFWYFDIVRCQAFIQNLLRMLQVSVTHVRLSFIESPWYTAVFYRLLSR